MYMNFMIVHVIVQDWNPQSIYLNISFPQSIYLFFIGK